MSMAVLFISWTLFRWCGEAIVEGVKLIASVPGSQSSDRSSPSPCSLSSSARRLRLLLDR